MENALRTEFTQIAMNPKKLRGFTEAEQDAIRRVVDGSLTEKGLRLAGKFAVRGPVSGVANIMTGVATGNPVTPAVTALIGEVGKRSAEAMRMRSANLVDALIRSGGNLPQAQALSPAQRMIIDSLLDNQNTISNQVRQQLPVR